MDCNDVETKLQLLIDDELNDCEVEELRVHFQLCPPCEKQFELEKKFKDVIREKICKRHLEDEMVGNVREFVMQHA